MTLLLLTVGEQIVGEQAGGSVVLEGTCFIVSMVEKEDIYRYMMYIYTYIYIMCGDGEKPLVRMTMLFSALVQTNFLVWIGR